MKSFRTSILLLVAILLAPGVNAQKIKELLAEKYLQEFDYPRAALILEDIAAKGNSSAEVYRKLANSYSSMGDFAKAEDAYSRMVNAGVGEALDKLNYADILRGNGKYVEALNWYTQYNEEVPNDIRATQYINDPEIFLKLAGDSASTVSTLSINSAEADLGCTIMNELLVFSSARGEGVGGKRKYEWDSQPFLNLYTALLENGGVSEPMVMRKDVNSRFHDGTVSFDSIAQRLYFTRNNIFYGVVSKAEDGELNLGIYFVDIEQGPFGQEWSPLNSFEYNNPEYNFGHPNVSPDGKQLFLVSDMPGGFGGTDIYKCDLLGGAWGKPQNLGPGINTPGDEMYPFFSKDSVLYFSSNGHPGLGGMDLFMVPTSNDQFGSAFNLNYPINTRFNDHGIVLVDNDNGYFVSDRPDGMGSDDIYAISVAKPMITIKGAVVNKLTKMPVKNTDLSILDADGNPIERSELVQNDDGTFDIKVEYKSKYQLLSSKKGYFAEKMELNTAEIDLDSVVVEMSKFDYGAEGLISQGETQLPMDSVMVQLFDENDAFITELATDETGKYLFPLEPNSDYRVRVSKDGFFKQSARISTKGKNSGIMYTDFKLFELELDKVVRLDNIYYDVAKWNIRPDAAKELDKLVQTLWDNPTVQLELSAHTDCRGGDSYNLSLSKKRAKSAVDYIISKGIPAERIRSQGYGESDPVESCACNKCSDEEHQRNRRTQFKVLDF